MRRFWADEAGSSAVEFSIIASILFFLLLAVLQLGWALQIRNKLATAADRGVRYAMINPTATNSSISTYVTQAVPDYNSSSLSVATTTEIVGAISYRVIRTSYTMGLLGLPVATVTLNVSRRTPTP
jgi:Flp pilus assembly protein TadG